MASRKILKLFEKETAAHKTVKLPSGSNPGIPQSMAVLDNDTVAVVHNQGNNNNRAHLRKYTMNGYIANSDVVNNNLGHCNGATYCSKNGYIYCTGYNGSSNTNKIVVMNTNFKQEFTFNLPVAVTGIAYDKTVNKFYCSKGGNIYVFPYSAFTKNNRTTSYKKINGIGGTKSQDVGGYNGIVYCVMYYSSYGIIDMYQHNDGKYLGSIKIKFSETESCGFDSNGNFVYMTANQQRAIHWTTWKPQYKAGNPTTYAANNKGTAASAFVATAKAEGGTKETGNNNVKYNTWYYKKTVSGDKYAWCAVFVLWCANQVFGNNYTNIFSRTALPHNVQESAVSHGGAWVLKGNFAKNAASAAKCMPGDIFTIDPNGNGLADHVGIITGVSGEKLLTVEGNHGDKVDITSRKISEIFRVARPKWPDGSFVMPGGVDEGYYGEEGEMQQGPFAHPEQLYSSAQWDYLGDKEETDEQKRLKERQKSIKQLLQGISINDSFNNKAIPDIVIPNISSASNYRKTKTKLEGEITGSHLPSTINYVEAPYARVTLGGVTFGTYQGGNYPNYIQSVNIRKTNGSMNEYTINLIHQVSPGDNPNYIDNLISANGYNKIRIEYGDAEAGITYRDVNALLIDVKSKYDFFNSCISYTLSATSSSVMSAINRRNYPAVTDKPSNIINKMLYDTKELLQYFPAMTNRSFVSSNNLIPTNDTKVELDAVENTTPLNYLNTLVSSMTSVTSKVANDSIYYLDINDENSLGPYFTIQEVQTKMSSSMFPLIYEIDINYPDEDSLAFNFSVDTDFSWPLAYEYGGEFETYDYEINNSGKVYSQISNSAIKTTGETSNSFIKDKNWWTNVTEFPITATLEVKGLTSYILLLNYIKVNVYYFGNKRDSSGIYIVTGQEDSLSGNGFRTRLSLLRVAGDNQYITVDGRVVS